MRNAITYCLLTVFCAAVLACPDAAKDARAKECKEMRTRELDLEDKVSASKAQAQEWMKRSGNDSRAEASFAMGEARAAKEQITALKREIVEKCP